MVVLVAFAALAFSACGGKRAERRTIVPEAAANNDAYRAYDLLHRTGLRVAVPTGFSHQATQAAIFSSLKPRAGSIVPRGSVEKLEIERGPIGSVATRKGSIPSAKVPDFTGASLFTVDAWAQKHDHYWECLRLPPFAASNRPHLLDNYVVVHQSPAPGTILYAYKRIPHGVHLTPLIVRVAVRPAS